MSERLPPHLQARADDYARRERERLAKLRGERPGYQSAITEQFVDPAKPCRAVFWIDGDLPTSTHHDKVIEMRTNKDGKTRSTLTDSRALRAARTFYAWKVPTASAPVLGPVHAILQLRYRTNDKELKAPRFRMLKPDCDNAAKTFVDILAKSGWLLRDEQIAILSAMKIDLPIGDPTPAGLWCELKTLTTAPVIQTKPTNPGVLLPL